jgi:hypothetical protein
MEIEKRRSRSRDSAVRLSPTTSRSAERSREAPQHSAHSASSGRPTTREASQPRHVAEQRAERCARVDDLRRAPLVGAQHPTAATVEVTDVRAEPVSKATIDSRAVLRYALSEEIYLTQSQLEYDYT